MFNEFKNNPKLIEPFINFTISIMMLSTIATIIRLFAQSSPEIWVSSLNIAGTISVIFYMGLFKSRFTYFRWLVISKRKKYKTVMIFTSVIMFISPFILLNLCVYTEKAFNYLYPDYTWFDFIREITLSFFIKFDFIFSFAMSFISIIILILSILTRKIINNYSE